MPATPRGNPRRAPPWLRANHARARGVAPETRLRGRAAAGKGILGGRAAGTRRLPPARPPEHPRSPAASTAPRLSFSSAAGCGGGGSCGTRNRLPARDFLGRCPLVSPSLRRTFPAGPNAEPSTFSQESMAGAQIGDITGAPAWEGGPCDASLFCLSPWKMRVLWLLLSQFFAI